LLLIRAGGDVSLLVHAAPPYTSSSGSLESLTVQEPEEAFDGQFFYRIGVDPWSDVRTAAGVTFDLPALRSARWGFGAAAWAVTAGDADLVPWALLGINCAAAAALGAVGGGLARLRGRHAVWGTLFLLWPGFAYSISMDTAELAAMSLALAGLLCLELRRFWLAALALGLAVITRDTTVVIAAGVLVAGVYRLFRPTGEPPGKTNTTEDGRKLLLVGAASTATFMVWQFVQDVRFGELPLFSSGDNNLSLPFLGLIQRMSQMVPPTGSEDLFRVLSALVLFSLMGTAAWFWARTTAPMAQRLGWAFSAMVVLLLNDYLWSGATAFMRAATEAGTLSIALALGIARRWVLPLTGIALAGTWGLTAVAQIAKLG
jgi:hypothetical protein